MTERRVGWDAVGAGGALAVSVAAATLAAVALLGLDDDSNWILLLYAVLVSGLVAGAWVAARRRTDAPLVHGVLTAVAAYAVVALVGLGLRLVTDRDVDTVPLIFSAFVALSAGSVGGYLASRH